MAMVLWHSISLLSIVSSNLEASIEHLTDLISIKDIRGVLWVNNRFCEL